MSATTGAQGAQAAAEAVEQLVRLGLELRRWHPRTGYTGTYSYAVHLATDIHDDGQTLCGKLVGELVQLEGVNRVLNREAPTSGSWGIGLCPYCLEQRRRILALAAWHERQAGQEE